jgi:HAMP domain-containing protein
VTWPKRLLRNRLVLLFFFLAFVAVAVNVKLILNATTEIAKIHEITAGVNGESVAPALPQNPGSVHAFRNQLWLLLGVTAICFGSVLYLLVTRVIMPLKTIEHCAKELAEGNLSVTVPPYPSEELGELGQALNSVSANFQEVLLLMGTAVGHSYATIEKIEQSLQDHERNPENNMKDDVVALRKDIEVLRGVLKEFRFFQARFDGYKVVAQGPDS